MNFGAFSTESLATGHTGMVFIGQEAAVWFQAE